MAYASSVEWNSLEPVWVNVAESGTMDSTTGVVNYGSKIQSTGGNNGHQTSGYMKGTARGSFKIQFTLGHSWGWSTMYAANVSVVDNNSIVGGKYNQSGVNGISFLNNSSNNLFIVSKGVNGTSTTITSTTGHSNTMITFWRDANNVCYYKAGTNNTVTLGTFADHWVFFHGAQSPCSCELHAANNDRDTQS